MNLGKWFFGAILLLATSALAFRNFHDFRYNVKPEAFSPHQSILFGGFNSYWVGDGSFLLGFQFGANDWLEFGSKLSLVTEERFGTRYALIDIGAKYLLWQGRTLQTDVFYGINNSRGGGFILSYTESRRYTSKFNATYESRLGFFDAVTNGNWLSIELGGHARFAVADPLTLQMGVVVMDDLRLPIFHFDLSLVPGLHILVASNLYLIGECAVDIIGDDGIRLSLFAKSHF